MQALRARKVGVVVVADLAKRALYDVAVIVVGEIDLGVYFAADYYVFSRDENPLGSCFKISSTMLSAMISAHLSGCPGLTTSLVNRYISAPN